VGNDDYNNEEAIEECREENDHVSVEPLEYDCKNLAETGSRSLRILVVIMDFLFGDRMIVVKRKTG